MRGILILAATLSMLCEQAWAQTSDPARPAPGATPPSSGEQEQRCMQIANEAQRLRCLNEIRPGSGVTVPIDRPPNMPAEIIEPNRPVPTESDPRRPPAPERR